MAERTDSRDPYEHTRRIKDELSHLIQHLREDVRKVDDPQARALFETSAETLSGLRRAYEHYERKNEVAWQER